MKSKYQILQIIFLTVLALFVIFYKFNSVPKKLSFDEVEFAKLALSLDNKPYSVYSTLATGHSTLYFYIILLSIKTFGITNFALRFPAAIFGVLNVLIFYLIAKKVFQSFDSKIVKNKFLTGKIPIIGISLLSLFPFFAGFLFLSTRWFFSFPRFAFEVTFLLLLEQLSIWFFLRFKESKKILHLLLTAFLAGLAFHSYYPGRIFFLLPLIFLIFDNSKNRLKSIIIFAVIFLITILPLFTYLLTHKDIRISQELYLTNPEVKFVQKIEFGLVNIVKGFFMLNIWADLNGRHNYPGKPIFNPFQVAFLFLGIAYTILHFKKNYFHRFFLAYFVIGILPTLFTFSWENPNLLRTFTIIPSIVYFMMTGVLTLLNSDIKNGKVYLFTVFILSLIFLYSFAYDIRTYFKYQPKVFQSSFEFNGKINDILRLELWKKIGLL